MNSRPKIAVLLAAFNGMEWIEEQVESIFAQQSIDVDIYISVDLSTDDTHQWCQDFAKKNINIKV